MVQLALYFRMMMVACNSLLIHQANGFIAGAANNGAIGYPGLTSGAAHLIVTFGNDELKDLHLK